jgi:predicted outer membrane repeat protein
MKDFITVVLMAVVILAFGGVGSAGTVYVNPGGSIQTAINNSNNSDVIIVNPGTYYENLNIDGKAITLRSANPTNPSVVQNTVIDGSGSGSVISFGPDISVQTVVSGFTIENGTGYGAGIECFTGSPTITHCIIQNNAAGNNYGGGLGLSVSSSIIEYCTIQNNTSKIGGGGMSIEGRSPIIRHCEFINNSADNIYNEEGGAVFIANNVSALFEGCTFKDNSADDGGALYVVDDSVATFNNCTFEDNYAKYNGGAVHADGLHSIYVTHPIQVGFFDCIFSGNHTTSTGGCVYNDDSDMAYINCQFKNNYVSTSTSTMHLGGAIQNYQGYLTAINCTFLSNYAENTNYDSYGGAICNRESSLTIKNCSFRYNEAIAGGVAAMGGAIYNESTAPVIIDNSIFRSNNDNSEGEIYNTFSSNKPTISYCNIYGSGGSGAGWDTSLGIDGGGNIAAYPYFHSTTDLRLNSNSPCIDAGNNMTAGVDVIDIDNDGITTEWIIIDLDKNKRFVDKLSVADTGFSPHPDIGVVDMGAYEYQDITSSPDVNNDGNVDMLDLQCFATQWLAPNCLDCHSGDLNGDGDVNYEDFAIFAENW